MKVEALVIGCIVQVASARAQDAHIVVDDNAAAKRAAGVTAEYRLTSIRTECLYFDTDDEGTEYLVRVREKHSALCGGDPETSNTVFFMKIRKRDGHTTSTADNVDGVFHELRPLSNSR